MKNNINGLTDQYLHFDVVGKDWPEKWQNHRHTVRLRGYEPI